jgi:nucleotide-binding universal stress UspA family protein
MSDRFDGPRAVLVGVDGTPPSLRAGAYAAGLARRQHSRLIVAFVATMPSITGIAPEVAPYAMQELDDTASNIREQVVTQAERLGIEAEFVRLHGDPYAELARLAEERRVDLVVVGASAAPHHRYLGSVTFRLIRAHRWPVTVVP